MQHRYFEILSTFFESVTGKRVDKFASIETFGDEIRSNASRIARRAEKVMPQALDDLSAFYRDTSMQPFQRGKELGGLKVVLGGTSRFLKPQLKGVQKMALYADTILIPDPVLPWIEVDRTEERFKFVHLLQNVFMLLQLRPLVEADLAYPAIHLFPSYEKALEMQDETTRERQSELMLNFFRYYLKADFDSLEDVRKYSLASENEFLAKVQESRLFIAPGGTGHEPLADALEMYRDEIHSWRTEDHASLLESLSDGELAVVGILERLAPQYHLTENAEELKSNPMLVQDAHWHYYRLISEMHEGRLSELEVIEDKALAALHSLSNSQFEWLGNIPIEGLARLREENANEDFRRRLDDYVSILSNSAIEDLDRVVAEVSRGIASLIAEHKKKVREIDEEYTKRYAKSLAAGVISMGPILLPFLAPYISAVSPFVLAGKYAWDKVEEVLDRRKASRSLMGFLATAKEDSV